MKTNKLYFLLFGLIILFSSCSKTEKAPENGFVLSGTISNASAPYLVLTEIGKTGFLPNDTLPIDEKGNFSKSIQMQEATLYSLSYKNDYITLCPQAKEIISIKANDEDFSGSYSVSGSKESEALKELNARNLNTRKTLKAMSDYLKTSDIDNLDSIRYVFLSRLQNMQTEEEDFTIKFINSHNGSLVSLIGLYRTFEGRPLFDYRRDLSIYKDVLERLERTMPENQHTIILRSFIEQKETQTNERNTENK